MDSTPQHSHPDSLDACLDLMNTVEVGDDVPDELPSAETAIAFLVAHDLVHEDDVRRQVARDGEDRWFTRVLEARGALRELWDAQVEGRAPAEAALDTLNALLHRPPRIELRTTLAGVEIGHRHPDDDPTGEGLARAALALVDAIASGDAGRFRICANDECRWVFEDTSRGGRRRWCDMTTCGNRAKARRFRSRRRAGTAPGTATGTTGTVGD